MPAAITNSDTAEQFRKLASDFRAAIERAPPPSQKDPLGTWKTKDKIHGYAMFRAGELIRKSLTLWPFDVEMQTAVLDLEQGLIDMLRNPDADQETQQAVREDRPERDRELFRLADLWLQRIGKHVRGKDQFGVHIGESELLAQTLEALADQLPAAPVEMVNPPPVAEDDSDPIEDALERQTLLLYRRLKVSRNFVSYNTLADHDCGWRKSPSDSTITRALKKLQEALNTLTHAPELKIEHTVRRVTRIIHTLISSPPWKQRERDRGAGDDASANLPPPQSIWFEQGG
ncbi:MAG: hypothetical protein NTY19_23845 [Planctomycetota bacterium]|nr:hypothetical protein [Planctomycetota bacterium]